MSESSHTLERKKLIDEACENLIITTRAWIKSDYKEGNILIDLRKKIKTYNKLLMNL